MAPRPINLHQQTQLPGLTELQAQNKQSSQFLVWLQVFIESSAI